MPWNEADRTKYEVTRERYSSDLSDAEFALIFPLPSNSRQRRGGSPPDHARRGALGIVCFGARRKLLAGWHGRNTGDAAWRTRGSPSASRRPGQREPSVSS